MKRHGYSSDLKMSSRENETSKVLNEKILSPQANKPFGQPYLSQLHDLRQSAVEDPLVQLNSSMNYKKQSFKSKTNKDDELVKHMRNLPGYLQRVEKGDNLQEKALNVGVLDWGRLENWKSNEKRIPPRYNMKTSLSSSNPSLVESGSAVLSRTALSKTIVPQRKLSAPNTSHSNTSYKERLSKGVRWPKGKVAQHQNSAAVPWKSLDMERNPHRKDSSSGSNSSETKLDRSNIKHADQMTTPESGTSLSDWRNHGTPYYSHHTMSAGGNATKMISEDTIDLANEHCPGGHQSVVLLVPEDSPRSSCSHGFQLSGSRMSFDGKLTEANETRFSDCFSPEELHYLNSFSEVPHSCPLPLSSGTNDESECPYENKSFIEHSTTAEISKKFDQDTAEPPAGKGRHQSPNMRFSFSLGKMPRSFSFKESSAVPQVSSRFTSVKSGPVKSEASTGMDNFNRKKENANNRARSSPLRRLLDPLLKPKGAHTAEPVQPLKGNLNSTSFEPVNNNSEFLQSKKRELSSVQALLQLTMKNGVPFFKLVVDSSSDILAATVKQIPSSGKDDSSLIYAFYSVHEIKKKSGGWINKGSKGKSCGFGYNIVGQMKISNRKDQYAVRESVLYSSDIGQVDSMLNRELAAIVVKTQSEENGGNIERLKNTVVILPGGVHSLPISGGVPSPLINRWRSGGTCDCGGWDVGCKLRILTNQDTPGSSTSRLDLCYQGGNQNKKIFSLTPFQDGLYSLEYEASISLLQAFYICVAVVSSQKLAHIFEVNNLFEEKHISEPMNGNDKMKTTPIAVCTAEVPAKYVSSPPPSPVGRV